MTNEFLFSSVCDAVRLTLSSMAEFIPKETLCGYALCTDDNVSTLSYRAISTESLEASGDIDLLFCQTDWPYGFNEEAFTEVGHALQMQADSAEDIRGHVDLAFATLTRCLCFLKEQGIFNSSVFLSVLSTDPSEYSEELESQSVIKLNQSSIVQSRQRFLEKWGARDFVSQ